MTETLCKRTLCIWKPGEPVENMVCHYVHKGNIPNTGARRCMFCGELEPSDKAAIDAKMREVGEAIERAYPWYGPRWNSGSELP